jgi:tRNA (guanine-N7-)-methyltransferase
MPPHLYEDAPRLPDQPIVDPRELLSSGGAPVEMEIGPGRGGFLFERLAAFPQVSILGLEVRLKWAKIVDDRLRATGYGPRGRSFANDAKEYLPRFPEGCLSAVYVHFPDPWWKKRHRKRLVVSPEVVRAVGRALARGGELFVQTDVEERARDYRAIIETCECFEPVGSSPWVTDHPYVARSPRERRAMSDGLPIYRLRYRRGGPPLVSVPSSDTLGL